MNTKCKMKSTEIDLLAILSNVWEKKYIIVLVCIITLQDTRIKKEEAVLR
jgi:LPS O-antigen subunit length determinant protein (WzzB/FepE family)